VSELSIRRVGTNAGLVLLSRVVAAVTLVGLTPMIVTTLGKPGYGVWIIVSAATGLVGLVDVGIAPAVSRVVAFSLARGERAAVRSTAATATLMAVGLGVSIVVVGWPLAPALARLLGAPAALRQDAAEALRLAFATFGITTLSGVYEGVLIAQQRFQMLLAVRMTYVAGFATGAVVALQTGQGIVGLAASQAAAMGLALGVGVAACRSSFGPRRSQLFSRSSLRQLLRFGLPQQSSRIAYASALHYERLLVGGLIGASAAAEYGAASTVVAALCSLVAQATTVLVPALTRVHARDPEALEAAFRRAAVPFVAGAAGVLAAVAALAAPIVAGWLGPGFPATARYVQILTLGFLLWAVVQPGFALVQTLGKPGLEARGAGVVVLVNAIASGTLLAVFGAGAIAIGTSAALALGALAFWRVASARVRFLHVRSPPALAAIVLAILLAIALAAANDLFVPIAQMGRPVVLALAAGEAVVFAAAYLFGLVRLGCVPGALVANALSRRPRGGAAVGAPGPETA
jgi:O-antigen/teichoic acid export membrane protein